MIAKQHMDDKRERGMTLTELVIAIAIIAFAIPLILAASGGAHQTRQAAEADTRSSWLVRDVQRRIINGWSVPMPSRGFEKSFPFPSAGSPEVTMELSYNQDGELLAEANGQATYLVTVTAEPYVPPPNQTIASTLALISINIQYPAKAFPNKRKKLTYQFISLRNGIP